VTEGPDRLERPTPDGLAAAVRRRRERHEKWRSEGEPTFLQFVGRIGVLGWIIVAPILIGLFVGRWLDHQFGSGIFFSAPLLTIGAALGFWAAWRWMQRQ
jgi:ATP synthase protein I